VWLCENWVCLNLDGEAVLGRVPLLTLRHTTDLPLAPVAAREMSASGHYTRGRSLRINNKAVSVSSPCYRRFSSPTLFICFRRARLLTSAAARLSPQTCFRLPHCLGCFAACGFPHPPALRRADYRLPPVIVLPLWLFVFIVVVVRMVVEVFNRKGGGCAVILLLLVFLYYISRQEDAVPLYILLVPLGILRLLMIPALRRKWASAVCGCPARRSLSGTHSRRSVRAAAREAGKRTAAASAPASRHRSLAGVQWLLYVGKAAAEEPDDNGKRYAVSSRASPSAHCILLAPIPTGEINGQAPAFD
jgi:hypothetical protein